MENELMQIVGEENVKSHEKMAEHTTFRIGGEVLYFVTPENAEQFLRVVSLCKDCDIAYEIIGNGSNLLVTDGAIEGMVVSLYRKNANRSDEKTAAQKVKVRIEDMDFMDMQIGEEEVEIVYQDKTITVCKKEQEICRGKRDGKYVLTGAGAMLAKVAAFAGAHALEGLAFAGGIPGTIGGAVAMNAGAYGGEIKDGIVGAVVANDKGEVLYLNNQELELAYRNSIVLRNHYTVLAAVFYLEGGDKEAILADMRKYNASRREKQPLEYASAGSTFKRPEGYFAGKLIQDAGLKGYRVGDIMVSEKHSGFVVNVGNGTAKDVLQLVRHVQDEVRQQFGVELEMEVKTIGL